MLRISKNVPRKYINKSYILLIISIKSIGYLINSAFENFIAMQFWCCIALVLHSKLILRQKKAASRAALAEREIIRNYFPVLPMPS